MNLSRFRRGQGEIANHVIDEFAAGRLSRRDFIRRATVVGISIPVIDEILTACGSSAPRRPRPSTRHPVRQRDRGRQARCHHQRRHRRANGRDQPADGRRPGRPRHARPDRRVPDALRPGAEPPPRAGDSWKANSTADVWTFKIRQGVKFSNGHPLTADDVVYTYKLQTNAKSGGNALSAFGGVLQPSGVIKVDDYTVEFHLEAPNGNFPYLTSSDNYNMIILPSGYDPSKWQSTFVGTGPFILKSYTPKVGASFTANPSYWGTKALPARDQFHLLRHADARRAGADRRHHRRARPVLGLRRRAAARGRLQRHQAQVERAPRAVHAVRQGAVHRPPGTPGNRLDAGSAGDHHGAVQGLRGPG